MTTCLQIRIYAKVCSAYKDAIWLRCNANGW